MLWTLVLFFGASVMFGAIRKATEDEGTGVALACAGRGRPAAHRSDRAVHEAAPVRWVVDGMNVIGSRPTGWWRDRPGAMRELVEELDSLAERSGDPVTVVLDGEPFELEGGPRVTVQFASRRGPNAADDDIAALVESNPDPADLSVVTSDRDLARRVRDAGADRCGRRRVPPPPRRVAAQ